MLFKIFPLSFLKKVSEIALFVEVLHNAQSASVINKIVTYLDNKWVRVLLHESDFLQLLLLLSLRKQAHLNKCDFDSDPLLVVLPDAPEHAALPSSPYQGASVAIVIIVGIFSRSRVLDLRCV